MRKIVFFVLYLLYINLHAQESICDYKNEFLRIKQQLINYFQKFDYHFNNSINQRLLLVVLNERYSLNLAIPPHFLDLKVFYTEDSLVQKYYFKLVNRKYKFNPKELKTDYEKTIGIEHLLLWGIYSDFLPFDEECKNTIEQPLGYDSYSTRAICHILLAYYWAKNAKAKSEELQYFKNQFLKWKINIQKSLTFLKGFTDTALEGLLAFIFMEDIDSLPLDTIREFTYYHSSDGGYPWDEDKNANSNFHASLVALWLVCEILAYCNESLKLKINKRLYRF